MRIYFLTREPDVCQLLADRIAEVYKISDNEIKIFPIATSLMESVFEFGVLPDVLFLDFLYSQADSSTFYEMLKKKDKIFPIVYYNHPFPIPSKRKLFWTFNLEQTGYFEDLSKLEPLFELMEKALQDPNITPYVSAIQTPVSYKSTNLRFIEPLKQSEIEYYTSHFDNVITDSLIPENKKKNYDSTEAAPSFSANDSRFTNEFRTRNHLSHKIFLLFNYLYSKRNRHVTLDELKQVLGKGIKEETSNSIRLAVYRLRMILKQDIKTNMEILNYDYGYSLVENPE